VLIRFAVQRASVLGLYLLLCFGSFFACVAYAEPQEGAVDRPKTVLVLPPLNNSSEPLAPYSYLASVSKPLAEAGYYVFPVAVIDAFLKENGLPTPGEMHTISLDKINEVLAADAVLYVTINDYGQHYKLISSRTVFNASAKLVSVSTGEILWQGRASKSKDNARYGNNSIGGVLASALITQVLTANSDRAHDLAREANQEMFNGRRHFPKGPRYLSR